MNAQRFAHMPTGSGMLGAGSASGLPAGLRQFLAGEARSYEVRFSPETRILSKLSSGAGGYTVPTSFEHQLWEHLINSAGLLKAGATVMTTESGENLQIPKTTAHSTATLTAEAGTIAPSDPTFSQVTLSSYKYAWLGQLSNELVNDSGVDLTGYLARETGQALGNGAGAHFINGTGGGAQPAGIVPGATVGKTGATTVAGAFTGDDLIDLMHSVIAPYRHSPQCGWLMNDSTLASVRKLKASTSGDYYWEPSLIPGTPSMLLGFPVYTDPNIATVALSAKSVLFGDLSRYLIRVVRGVTFEQSPDFAFNADLMSYRAILRTDGVLVDQTGAVKVFQGGAS